MNIHCAEITVQYKSRVPIEQCPQINNPGDAVRLLAPMYKESMELREVFRIMLLNNANKVKATYITGIGCIRTVTADIKLILATALKTMSKGIILCHNHPSGSIQPSEGDIEITKKIKKACGLLDLELIDHIILTTSGYYSFAEERVL